MVCGIFVFTLASRGASCARNARAVSALWNRHSKRQKGYQPCSPLFNLSAIELLLRRAWTMMAMMPTVPSMVAVV